METPVSRLLNTALLDT